MMRDPERVRFLFADARELYADALEQVAAGKLRNAAEKAWGATKRASDALLVARTGHEPGTSRHTRRGLDTLRRTDPEFAPLWQTYEESQKFLHGQCFYRGECEPEDRLMAEIRGTRDYIQAAERLAGAAAEG